MDILDGAGQVLFIWSVPRNYHVRRIMASESELGTCDDACFLARSVRKSRDLRPTVCPYDVEINCVSFVAFISTTYGWQPWRADYNRYCPVVEAASYRAPRPVMLEPSVIRSERLLARQCCGK